MALLAYALEPSQSQNMNGDTVTRVAGELLNNSVTDEDSIRTLLVSSGTHSLEKGTLRNPSQLRIEQRFYAESKIIGGCWCPIIGSLSAACCASPRKQHYII